MKKANKQAAAEWQQSQQAQARAVKHLEEETCSLYYAARKDGTNIPCAETFEQAGMADVAALIRQARGLYQRALSLVETHSTG